MILKSSFVFAVDVSNRCAGLPMEKTSAVVCAGLIHSGLNEASSMAAAAAISKAVYNKIKVDNLDQFRDLMKSTGADNDEVERSWIYCDDAINLIKHIHV